MIHEQLTGLGWPALLACLIIGMVLILLSPYRAFLFALFISVAFGNSILTATRTESLGAFFNLYDACLVISIFAFLFDRKPSLRLPRPAMALIAILFIGFANTWVQAGVSYTLLRALRWSITIPLQFFLAANLVRGEDRVKSLMMTLFVAVIIAEIQHIVMVALGMGAVGQDVELLRSLDFYKAGSIIWLTAGFYVVRGYIPRKNFQIGIGVLFFLANISTVTRSMFLGMAAGAFIFYLWYLQGENAYRWLRFKGLLFATIFGMLIALVVGFGSFVSMLEHRMVDTVQKHAETESRVRAFEVETREWRKSNLIIGCGLDYQQRLKVKAKAAPGTTGAARGGVAFGHLGYISYLSQLGIIGFLIYGFYFPIACLRRSRRLFMEPNLPPAMAQLSALSGVLFIVYPITFLFSGSFMQDILLAGILPGAIWANSLSQWQDINETSTLDSEISSSPDLSQKRTPIPNF